VQCFAPGQYFTGGREASGSKESVVETSVSQVRGTCARRGEVIDRIEECPISFRPLRRNRPLLR
jgi:hypothetical protein